MKKINQLLEKRALLSQGGGEERIQKQHQQGKLTARENELSCCWMKLLFMN